MARSPHHADPPEHDQWGLEALRDALQDLAFPRTGEALRKRVGQWRIPMPGRETIRLGPLLEPFEDRTFRSADEAVKAIGKRWSGLKDPRGPWPGQDDD